MPGKTRAVPAVGAAIIAAAGIVWVIDNTDTANTRTKRDNDRMIRAELHTTGNAVFIVLARSLWRGEIAQINRSISQFDVVDIFAAPGEPIEVIVLGEQNALNSRQTVRCRITEDGKEVTSNILIVRTGETKIIKCHKNL